MNSLLLSVASRFFVTLLLMFSVFMLLRGHNLPGGGFIGGLIGAAGFIVYAIANGSQAARRTLRIDPRVIASSGVGIALLAGLSAALFGKAFFTGTWLIAGSIKLSTVIIFDIGVYFAVFGAILTLVFALEEAV
ncbi:Na(+)/H(+) antiporter subunit B [Aquimixticola soesokkakensis]|uniref:Na(+)/H(+) antiporter subunit B n=1 Tax=Aquimixticola soesokkakensis TaxID=1519096 RepID=A0A1Y5RT39_9RHOB|nr:Na+/H+ antiporter subunit B [Aquimixticola soesokkakensis]SLN24393.1 Na(+)/H(+) antiporter subunit B [Aquimixticola soesokkakensis]